MARSRGRRGGGDYQEFWPGYVDVLSTLLMTVTFLLSVFMIGQYLSSQELNGKDDALKRLTRQLSTLTDLFSLEQTKSKSAGDELSALQASLTAMRDENSKLQGVASAEAEKGKASEARIMALASESDSQKQLSVEAQSKVDILNRQLSELRRQIAALSEALDVSAKKDVDAQKKIDDLGTRLNAALARQVQELQRYRSDFFGRLREALKARKDIRVVGDRFVFESEVLFPSAQATLTPEGLSSIGQLATAITELEHTIPPEINWALQVDGHTDARQITSAQFPSNWELSSARAITVVKYLISRGVSPRHLLAAGYGEFQPIEEGVSEDALRKNRRIELKLTNR